jgi:hypothetical protein
LIAAESAPARSQRQPTCDKVYSAALGLELTNDAAANVES